VAISGEKATREESGKVRKKERRLGREVKNGGMSFFRINFTGVSLPPP